MMTTRYLTMQGLNAIMCGNGLTLKAPYSQSASEKAWMTRWLRQQFSNLFGRDFPDIEFV